MGEGDETEIGTWGAHAVPNDTSMTTALLTPANERGVQGGVGASPEIAPRHHAPSPVVALSILACRGVRRGVQNSVPNYGSCRRTRRAEWCDEEDEDKGGPLAFGETSRTAR